GRNMGPGAEDISAQLDLLLRDKRFASSPRLSRFLEYVVTEHLAGRTTRLTAYGIGLDVFGRSEDFDPQEDNIVRVTAGRLRQKLSEYYASDGRAAPVMIALPKGGYAPTITEQSAELVEASLERVGIARPALIFASIALLGLVALTVVVQRVQAPGPSPPVAYTLEEITRYPVVEVHPFANLSGDQAFDPVGVGVQQQLAHDLSRFRMVKAAIAKRGPETDEDPADYYIQGEVLSADGDLDVVFRLIDGTSHNTILQQRLGADLTTNSYADALTQISSRLSGAFSGPEGAIVRAELSLIADALAQSPLGSGDVSAFLCYSSFKAFELVRSFEKFKGTYRCLEQAIAEDETDATLVAILSWMTVFGSPERGMFTREQLSGAFPGREFTVERAEEIAEAAVLLNPADDNAHHYLSHIHWLRRDSAAAIESARRSLAINRGSSEVLGDLGVYLADTGQWPEALEMAAEARARAPYASPTHYLPDFFRALLDRDAETLTEIADISLKTNGPYNKVLALLAASVAGDEEKIAIYLPLVQAEAAIHGGDPLHRIKWAWRSPEILQAVQTELAKHGLINSRG
ncbi:MAG: hypothetical protein AAGJ50_11265, partial [Pseudomonadota bacterium]